LWPYVISALIVEHVGPKRALELMMTGERLSAERRTSGASSTGSSPATSSTTRSARLVDDAVAGAPLALALGRRAYHQSRDMSPAGGDGVPPRHARPDGADRGRAEGIGAFFEKREPVWKGR
jgi:enoyl-CoA hydratase